LYVTILDFTAAMQEVMPDRGGQVALPECSGSLIRYHAGIGRQA
jgi:hypothetical protein